MNKPSRLRNLNKPVVGQNESGTASELPKKNTKWRTIIALLLMYTAIIMNWQWAWGILFLFWVIPDIISGITYFIEPIDKKENPLLYWIIIISWILMALYSVSTLFIDYEQLYY